MDGGGTAGWYATAREFLEYYWFEYYRGYEVNEPLCGDFENIWWSYSLVSAELTW